eukprot:2091510-Rhodomonas_salina.1
MERCRDNAVATSGSSAKADCVCAAGFFGANEQPCTTCPANRFCSPQVIIVGLRAFLPISEEEFTDSVRFDFIEVIAMAVALHHDAVTLTVIANMTTLRRASSGIVVQIHITVSGMEEADAIIPKLSSLDVSQHLPLFSSDSIVILSESFTSIVTVDPVVVSCPPNSFSQPGSSSALDCQCIAGY